MRNSWVFLLAAAACLAQKPPVPEIMREPSISRDALVFSGRGYLWIAPRSGGPARRLTEGDWNEHSPSFSPDGTLVAFTRERCVYVVKAAGGTPRRLTWHPAGAAVAGWSPDGRYVLFHSGRNRPLPSMPRLFRVPVAGGMEEPLPMPVAGFASYSPDGRRIAYSPIPEIAIYTGRKRYRGGATAFIALYDPSANRYEELSRSEANDLYPMWHRNSVYFASDRTGTVNLYRYDLAVRSTQKLTSYDDFDVSEPSLGPDAIAFHIRGQLYIYSLATGEISRPAISLPPTVIAPEQRALWTRVFDQAWKTYRDRAAAPVPDWSAIRAKYEPLVAAGDLQFVLREMLAETGQSHIVLRGPAPKNAPPDIPTAGLLGADYTVENGTYRFARIYRGPRSPLASVNDADYLLAVNGHPLRAPANLFAAFEGAAGTAVTLTVNSEPSSAGSRQVTITPIRDEQELRYAAWVEERARRVREAGGGRIAYIHVPAIEPPGAEACRRQFENQRGAQAVILDVRNNNGGTMTDFFLDFLARRKERTLTGRGHSVTLPEFAVSGPKVILANEQSVSGAEELAYLAQRRKLATFVGARTSGSLIGTGTEYKLEDGSVLLIPEWAFYTVDDGKWYPEGRGAVPNYAVDQRPDLVVAGQDPQLEKAIEIVLQELKDLPQPPEPPRTPDGFPRFPPTVPAATR